MRYQVIQLIQLMFALSLMFGAFVGGIAVGWWRWGRREEAALTSDRGRPAVPGALFSPEGREDEILLAEAQFDVTGSDNAAGQRNTEGLVFATGPMGAGHPSPPLLTGVRVPTAAIGPASDRRPANAEALDA